MLQQRQAPFIDMTLIITIVKPNYIWQSSDNRVSINNIFRDDNHIKHIGIKCPDGTALLSYTGLAELTDGTKISDWIRTTIRGETRTVEQTLQLIAEKASREISNSCFLAFLIGAFVGEKAWIYQITNADGKNWQLKPLKVNFSIIKMPVQKPLWFSAGSGSGYISKADKDLLTKIINKKPRDPKEYSSLLSEINKRTAVRDKQRISESCVTVSMPAKGEPVQTQVYGLTTPSTINTNIPFVLFGIDSTDIMGLMQSQLKATRLKLPQVNKKTINEKLKEIANEAVKPRDS